MARSPDHPILASYAVEHSHGRRHSEPSHPYRNDFQRDRDRVIHSRAFRRLEAKTQVFTRRYSDHFRNRLTHTLEVAQISRTIAAQLIDATDELAYNTADLDDGFEAHLLTLDQIKEGVPVFARFFSEVERLYPDAAEKLQFNEVIRRMLDRWIGDLIENTRAEINSVGAEFQSRPSAIVTIADIRACPRRLITLSSETEAERRQTKAFLHEQVYFSAALDPEKEAAERIITDLFELWMKHPEKLPESYQGKAEAEPLARVVCDYVAGMTDTYIYEQYEKHCG